MIFIMRQFLLAASILLLLGTGGHVFAQSPAFEGVCQEAPAQGAQVKFEKYCHLFRHYENNRNKILDTRIGDALGVKSSRETRLIGLVIAISKYPKMPGHDLPAAAVDGERITNFLINSQQFDEVITLTDQDADDETIRYFLRAYIPNHAIEYNGKARVLVAYSGHGRFGGPALHSPLDPALVLSGADAMDATSGVYSMGQLYEDVKALRQNVYQVITLINACYGGEVFSDVKIGGIGGNPDAFRLPGSYAITAGDDRNEVPSIIESRGSLFFDLIIEGITSGRADLQYWESYVTVDSSSGAQTSSRGLTRLNELVGYLTGKYDKIVSFRSQDSHPLHLSPPWIGPADPSVARGGFFFLSEKGNVPAVDIAEIYKHADGEAAKVFGEKSAKSGPLELPAGPISAIPGHPEILVFKTPETYPIRGFDFSSAEGKIDWKKLNETSHPRFIYSRAVGWSGIDGSFDERWDGARSIGADHGAYAKFDFCLSVDAQIARLFETVRIERDALPVAIELVHPFKKNLTQFNCLTSIGLYAARSSIIEFAMAIRKHYGKTPLLFGNRNDLSQLIDERSEKYMIWMGNYDANGVKSQGRNPWTLWQYSGTLDIPGVGSNTTGDAFFGSEVQYAAFKHGEINVARDAALRTGGEP